MWLMGSAANLQFFVLHDFWVVFLFLFSWGHLMIAFSFLLSIFFKSTRTSTAAIFLMLLLITTTGSTFLSVLIEDDSSTEASFATLMWLPPMVMQRVVLWLALSGAFREQVTLENW